MNNFTIKEASTPKNYEQENTVYHKIILSKMFKKAKNDEISLYYLSKKLIKRIKKSIIE